MANHNEIGASQMTIKIDSNKKKFKKLIEKYNLPPNVSSISELDDNWAYIKIVSEIEVAEQHFLVRMVRPYGSTTYPILTPVEFASDGIIWINSDGTVEVTTKEFI